MKEVLFNAATVILVACAIVVTGLVVRREFSIESSIEAAISQQVHEIDDWQELATAGHLLGSETAPIRIIEFSDFQCPFCAQALPVLEAIRAEYPGRIAVIYRHYPLSRHEYALGAALASECAAAQGRFEVYHDLLFKKQDSLGIKSWASYAREVGIADLARFRDCVGQERFRGRVERDIRAAERIGVNSTPSFIVEGEMRSGAPSSPAMVERWIEHALADG